MPLAGSRAASRGNGGARHDPAAGASPLRLPADCRAAPPRGDGCNRKQVRRLMREDNLLCLRQRPFVPVTTASRLGWVSCRTSRAPCSRPASTWRRRHAARRPTVRSTTPIAGCNTPDRTTPPNWRRTAYSRAASGRHCVPRESLLWTTWTTRSCRHQLSLFFGLSTGVHPGRFREFGQQALAGDFLRPNGAFGGESPRIPSFTGKAGEC
jgi:hypothetical protein